MLTFPSRIFSIVSISDYTSKKQITNEEQVFLDNIGELHNYAFKFFSINNQTEKVILFITSVKLQIMMMKIRLKLQQRLALY